tara:strand:- start:2021 stop:2866 length:846 start_codon:yes stop_codon:yes gene_type:complete
MVTSKLVNYGSNILKNGNVKTHRIDSEILLSHVLKISREKLLITENSVSPKKTLKFKSLISRRLKSEPIAYILQTKEFRSKDFIIKPTSLIPRPETELLIDPIVKFFKNKNLFFLDVGVGTGCIISSILMELKNSSGVGLDISAVAISNTLINLRRQKLENRARLFNKSINNFNNYMFDLVISNPPYINRRDIKRLSDDIKKFEPRIALDGGNDGLDVIKKVIYKSKYILKNNGLLALEIGNGQYISVNNLLKRNNFRQILALKDYNNNIRCIFSTLQKNV